MLIDYAPVIARCCGVKDEPSILNRCSEEYSAIRATEGAAGHPIGLLRIEKQRGGARLTRRFFENSKSKDLKESGISDSDWKKLVGLLRTSGFRTFEYKNSVWMPDGPSLWIEACVEDQFRSISINPVLDNRMSKVVDFLAELGT